MRKIDPAHYRDFIAAARSNSANRVYPLSIAGGVQAGDICVNDPEDAEAVLFWHFCGFGFITGMPSERFLRQLWEEIRFARSRRMVLITHEEAVVRFFRALGCGTGERIEYRYEGTGAKEKACGKAGPPDPARTGSGNGVTVPESGTHAGSIHLARIGSGNIGQISGKIVPGFSWESPEAFLEKSFGYAAFDGTAYCGTAFASGISSEEADIGVEVVPDYRGRGIAAALVKKTCEEALRRGLQPVWDHHGSNIASGRTALRCGFVPRQINTYVNVKP